MDAKPVLCDYFLSTLVGDILCFQCDFCSSSSFDVITNIVGQKLHANKRDQIDWD